MRPPYSLPHGPPDHQATLGKVPQLPANGCVRSPLFRFRNNYDALLPGGQQLLFVAFVPFTEQGWILARVPPEARNGPAQRSSELQACSQYPLMNRRFSQSKTVAVGSRLGVHEIHAYCALRPATKV